MKNRPMTRVNLDKAIARMAGDDPRLTVDMRMSMANAIVGQFLSSSAQSSFAKAPTSAEVSSFAKAPTSAEATVGKSED